MNTIYNLLSLQQQSYFDVPKEVVVGDQFLICLRNPSLYSVWCIIIWTTFKKIDQQAERGALFF